MRKQFFKAIYALVMMLLLISLCAIAAHGFSPWCVPHSGISIRPNPPDGFGAVNPDGSYDVRQLYNVLVVARPDVYPFTYIRDRQGIPTVSTPYSPENLLAIVNEVIRIGSRGRTMEEFARMEKLMVFLRYVKDAIGRGKLIDGYILPQELIIRDRILDKRVPFVEIITSQAVYKPGDLFSITLNFFNPTASEVVADVFIGFTAPDGKTYFFGDQDIEDVQLDSPSSYPALLKAQPFRPYTGRLDIELLSLPAAEIPAGEYTLFAAMVRPGTVQKDQPEIIGGVYIATVVVLP